MTPHTLSPDAGPPMRALRLLPEAERRIDPLRIAVLAPPWIPVPPRGYGGIEAVVDLLCATLVKRGHDVTLLPRPGRSQPRG